MLLQVSLFSSSAITLQSNGMENKEQSKAEMKQNKEVKKKMVSECHSSSICVFVFMSA